MGLGFRLVMDIQRFAAFVEHGRKLRAAIASVPFAKTS